MSKKYWFGFLFDRNDNLSVAEVYPQGISIFLKEFSQFLMIYFFKFSFNRIKKKKNSTKNLTIQPTNNPKKITKKPTTKKTPINSNQRLPKKLTKPNQERNRKKQQKKPKQIYQQQTKRPKITPLKNPQNTQRE